MAIEPTGKKNSIGGILWRCKCDCGGEHVASTAVLRSGDVKSCGCLHKDAMREAGLKSREDLSGQRFGRLRVIEPTRKKGKHWCYLCECDCGKTCEVTADLLRRGKTLSCGCLQRERAAHSQENRTDYVDGTNLSALDRKTPTTNTSGVKGVHFDKRAGKWRAVITLKGKRRYLGYFDDLASAAEARREAENELFEPILEEHGRRVASEEEYEATLASALEKDRRKNGKENRHDED